MIATECASQEDGNMHIALKLPEGDEGKVVVTRVTNLAPTSSGGYPCQVVEGDNEGLRYLKVGEIILYFEKDKSIKKTGLMERRE